MSASFPAVHPDISVVCVLPDNPFQHDRDPAFRRLVMSLDVLAITNQIDAIGRPPRLVSDLVAISGLLSGQTLPFYDGRLDLHRTSWGRPTFICFTEDLDNPDRHVRIP